MATTSRGPGRRWATARRDPAIGTTAGGLIAFALVSALFCAVRRRLGVLIALWTAVIAGFAVSAWPRGVGENAIEVLITAGGLELYALGLLIVRLMLTRSISLRLLGSYARGEHIEEVHDHVARRLDDIRRWRLASCADGHFRPTAMGRLTAWIMAVLYALTSRIPK